MVQKPILRSHILHHCASVDRCVNGSACVCVHVCALAYRESTNQIAAHLISQSDGGPSSWCVCVAGGRVLHLVQLYEKKGLVHLVLSSQTPA